MKLKSERVKVHICKFQTVNNGFLRSVTECTRLDKT